MDYVVGSVAALITGNVTPSRPRILKRALTPTKHQPSPNVTPKSEFVDDRSIFLSPSVQKKKAIVKKSPKRIFQNPDLETTCGEDNISLTSPKADKVKKHLKDDLDSDMGSKKNKTDVKSSNKNDKTNVTSPNKNDKNKNESLESSMKVSSNVNIQSSNENTPKKKKKKNKNVSDNVEEPVTEQTVVTEASQNVVKSPKKMKQRRKSVIEDDSNKENANTELEAEPKTTLNKENPTQQTNKSQNAETVDDTNNKATSEDNKNVNAKKKNKRRKKKPKQKPDGANVTEPKENITENKSEETNQSSTKKKNRKRKKSKAQQTKPEPMEVDHPAQENEVDEEVPAKKSKSTVNPNAITDKESDSEHESDDEIESENEEINKKVFAEEPMADESSDDEEKEAKPQKENVEKKEVKKKEDKEVNTEDDVKRTLFVGNVPFSAKCKKEIKKIFNKHGQIETIRIRTVPVKDGRYTPKLAVIKNELHPERTTVNVYIKYADEESVEKALSENNTVLNDHHLRVSKSSSTGVEHDPKCSIFVGNLPFAIEDETLRQKFENCGEIESVRIIRDKKTNAGKGFGYVNFASKDAVELALALTEEDLTIKNRIVRVKRCTQLTSKQKQKSDKGGFKNNQGPHSQRQFQGNQRIQTGHRQNQFNQRQGNQRDYSGQRQNQGNQRDYSGQRQNQGNQRDYSGQRQNQGNQRDYSGQRQNQGNQRDYSGQRQNQGNQRQNQGSQRRSQGRFQRENQGGQRFGNKDELGQDGAHRRIMQKRKTEDAPSNEGPPNKRQNINQPAKEKKARKEFVGMTAEKKKKRKFDKGQKKKKALSEILTK